MAEVTQRQEVRESSTYGRRFTEPLTNVPNILNFTCIVKDFEINQYTDLGVPWSFDRAFIPPLPPSALPLSTPRRGPPLPPLPQPRTLFDIAIFYADSRESEDEVMQFMELVEILSRNSPKKPRIWASVCDIDGLGSSYLEAVERGLSNTNVYFLYIDKWFAISKWATFQQDQCLHQYFQETKVIVPVETIKNYTMPFALRVFTSLKLWKMIDNIVGLTVKTFLLNPERHLKACNTSYLEKVQTMFRNICNCLPNPQAALEEENKYCCFGFIRKPRPSCFWH